MPLERWLGELPDMAPVPSQVAVLAALEDVLDRLQPLELDRERSGIRWITDEPDDPEPLVLVTLEHQSLADATVEVAIWSDQARIEWLGEDDHTSECEAGDEEWTSAVAQTVGAILRGDYAVEETHWLGRWIKTRTLDVSDPSRPVRIKSTVHWPWFFLRPPGARVTCRRLDYGVHP